MKVTPLLFEAFLKCPTKCYLRSIGQTGSGNAYAEWVREQNHAYGKEAAQHLVAAAGGGAAVTTPETAELRSATWRVALNLNVAADDMESRLHAVERIPAQGRGRPAQFVPIRFGMFNKLTKEDRLLLAFDALVLPDRACPLEPRPV